MFEILVFLFVFAVKILAIGIKKENKIAQILRNIINEDIKSMVKKTSCVPKSKNGLIIDNLYLDNQIKKLEEITKNNLYEVKDRIDRLSELCEFIRKEQSEIRILCFKKQVPKTGRSRKDDEEVTLFKNNTEKK